VDARQRHDSATATLSEPVSRPGALGDPATGFARGFAAPSGAGRGLAAETLTLLRTCRRRAEGVPERSSPARAPTGRGGITLRRVFRYSPRR